MLLVTVLSCAWRLLNFVSHPAGPQQRLHFLNRLLIGLARSGRPFPPEIILDFFEQRRIGFAHWPIPAERGQVADDLTHHLKRAMGESFNELEMPLLEITIEERSAGCSTPCDIVQGLVCG